MKKSLLTLARNRVLTLNRNRMLNITGINIKYRSMKYTLFFLLALTFVECKKSAIVNIDRLPKDGLVLTSWQVLGPFQSTAKDSSLNFDNLNQFGFNENSINYNEFKKIVPKVSQQISKNQYLVLNSYKIDFNKLFNYTNEITINGNVYCACNIRSIKETRMKLNYSADDGSKIWLNNKLIFDYNRVCGLRYYENYIDLDLKTGDNFLLIKVNNIAYNWEMFASIEKESVYGLYKYKNAFSLEYGKYFLKRSIIKDSIFLNNNLPNELYTFILSHNNRVIVNEYINDPSKVLCNIAKLEDGLYSASLIARGDTFHELFYKGNIIVEMQLLINKINKFQLKSDSKRNMNALIYRFNHLLIPSNMGKDESEKRDWDKKIIFLYKQLNYYLESLSNNIDPEYNVPGGSIKTYISKIDSGVQYYQLYVPENIKANEPLPLVIEMPKFMNWHQSPLETYRFANIRLSELFEEIANQYNMIILDPGCRTVDKTNKNSIDEVDLWENIDNLKKYYNIDTNRIYLRGACLSSWSALKMAVKYPDKFAAISLTSPEIPNTNYDNPWMQSNMDPIQFLKNISNIPILNIHCVVDSHSPISESEKLFKDTKKAGIKNYTYIKIPIELKTYYSEEYMKEIFDFFKKYSLNPKPNEIYLSTGQLKYNHSYWIHLTDIQPFKNAYLHGKIENNKIKIHKENVFSYTIDLKKLPYTNNKKISIEDNGVKIFDDVPKSDYIFVPAQQSKLLKKNERIEGPFANIFTRPFLIVLGSEGDEIENKNIKAISDTINKYWRLRYFATCRTKIDKNVTLKDIEETNLLLIGSPQSNTLIRRIIDKLPAYISENTITIAKNEVNGTNLGFYLIYPNPQNKEKYVAIIGYNSPFTITLGYEESKEYQFNDISNYGWFDYKIWNSKTNSILKAGYFDKYWE